MKEKIAPKFVRVDDDIEFVIKRAGVHSDRTGNSGQLTGQEYSFSFAGAPNLEIANASMEDHDTDAREIKSRIKKETIKPFVASSPFRISIGSPGCSLRGKRQENQLGDAQFGKCDSLPYVAFKESVEKKYKNHISGHLQNNNSEDSVNSFAEDARLHLPNSLNNDKSVNAFSNLYSSQKHEIHKTNYDLNKVARGSYCMESTPQSYMWKVSKDHIEKAQINISPEDHTLESSFDVQNEFVVKKEQFQNDFIESSCDSRVIKPVMNDLSVPPYNSNSTHLPDAYDIEGNEIRSPYWLSSKMVSASSERVIAGTLEQKSLKNNIQLSKNNRVYRSEKSTVNSSFLKKNIPSHKPRKTEVDLLYDNLKEISWAQDKSFTNLLVDKDNARRLDRGSSPKTLLVALNKIKSSIPNHSILTRRLPNFRRLCRQGNDKAKQHPSNVETLKPKYGGKQNVTLSKKPSTVSKPSKSKTMCSNVKNIRKVKPNSLYHNAKDKGGGKLNNMKKLQMKPRLNSITQSQISQNSNQGFKLTKNLSAEQSKVNLQSKKKKKDLQKEKEHIVKDSENTYDNNGDSSSEAGQNTPELRVTLEPLENSNQWGSETHFHKYGKKEPDAYKKKNIQQAMYKAISEVNQGHVESVLREVQDSIMDVVSVVKPSRKRKYEEESVRTSVRQSECAFRYKEIVVKKHQNYIQVVLVPNSLKQNCLSIEAMKELKEAFISARKDPNCRAVLLNSSGSFFCTGIDLSQLFGTNKKQVAEEMAVTIRDLILALGTFPKPVVAAVNGDAIGLGVALLAFCDIVLASDKATFCIPSAALGYLPEAAITLTLPQVVGATVASEMLLQGRKLTAEQALRHGLVSEVLWPTRLMEGTIPRMQRLVSQSLQVMEATKTMVRCHLWEKLAVQLEREWRLLPSQWLHSACQQNIKKVMQSGWLLD